VLQRRARWGGTKDKVSKCVRAFEARWRDGHAQGST
jgi:hypothetical protein